MRAVLNEEQFKEYIESGSVVIDGREIRNTPLNMATIIAGGIAKQDDIEYILSDIGYDRINNILNNFYQN